MKKIALFFAGIVVLLICGCGGPSPEKAYTSLVSAVEKEDYRRVYDLLSVKSQAQVDVGMKMMASMAQAFSEGESDSQISEDMSGRDLFAAMCESENAGEDIVVQGKVLHVNQDGDTATVIVSREDGETEFIMVKEDGEWKLVLEM